MLADLAFVGVDMSKVRVAPFGVDVERFAPAGRATDRGNGSAIVVGTVKSLAHIYGIDLLIEAFARAVDGLERLSSDRLRLVIVGAGPDEALLRARAQELGVMKRTTFLGSVAHSDVPRALHSFDIFAALSRRESFGVAVLEASAVGLPVIVSDAGGLPEVVQAGNSGLVVPNGDVQAAASAIIRLVREPATRQQMGAAGRRFVLENFSWRSSAHRMVSIYEEMLRPVAI
jgi:glycosyltransferase involved in cell wall biosynthesis